MNPSPSRSPAAFPHRALASKAFVLDGSSERDALPSSTQQVLSDPPPGAAPVYCPECSLLLIGKLAAL
eukprot:CAMPEP_0174845520 /NCGR_PEP_ID=MMETSP1114-20130205/11779_1 /TAXON_ID=312471 /ORGANISM="Neobodo designis, Strain CCAP 1951/1" /LENGTH=67 /DNA_ID=CAMNT_0016079767 /DNA_START=123 /DNA_END=323 /DNA_ORIENTATION=+